MNTIKIRQRCAWAGMACASALALAALTACERQSGTDPTVSGAASSVLDAPVVASTDNAASHSADAREHSATDLGVLTDQNPTSARPALSDTDKAFIRDASAAGLFEAQVAQIGASKASESVVKSYATMLLQDHQAANDKLKLLAKQLHADAPASISPEQKKVLDDLQSASGSDFDQKFVQAVGAKAHEKDIALFEKISHDAGDTALRDFARATLPTLKGHLSMAKELPVKG